MLTGDELRRRAIVDLSDLPRPRELASPADPPAFADLPGRADQPGPPGASEPPGPPEAPWPTGPEEVADRSRLPEPAGRAEIPGLAAGNEPPRLPESARLPGHAGLPAADQHVQPNGVDLSLDAVWRFREPGVLGVGDVVRHIPAREELPPDVDGWFALPPGTYGIRYAEFVQMPTDCGGLCFPRSSLLRMGLTVPTAVWDAGYAGRGEGLLVVTSPHGVRLQRGARIVQLVVFRLTQPTEGYRGRYLNENR